MRKAILVGLCALVAGACGQVPHQGPQAGDQVLYIATTSGVAAVDARTHASLALLPPGVPSPDWKHYYLASDSLLLDLNPTTGATQRSMPVPAGYTLPLVTAGRAPGGLSQDGGWLVLEKHDAAASHLLDVRTTFAQTPGRIDLAGDFTFDAVSNDGTRIYLIQHAADGHYFVRDYVVGSGLEFESRGTRALAGVRSAPSNTNNIPIADELCPDSVSVDCRDRRRLAFRQARARRPSARPCARRNRKLRTPT